jgi:hypothetical protein
VHVSAAPATEASLACVQAPTLYCIRIWIYIKTSGSIYYLFRPFLIRFSIISLLRFFHLCCHDLQEADCPNPYDGACWISYFFAMNRTFKTQYVIHMSPYPLQSPPPASFAMKATCKGNWSLTTQKTKNKCFHVFIEGSVYCIRLWRWIMQV